MMMNLFSRYKKVDFSDIRRLVEMFENGETSLAQERALFVMFSRKRTLPPDLEKLRPMMQWYASLERKASSMKHKETQWRVWLSTAAAVAVVSFIGFTMMFHNPTHPQQGVYGGSYVIRNGVKYTNLNNIMPDLMQAESVVSERAIVNEEMSRFIDMDDPAVAKIMKRIMSDEEDFNIK